MRTYVFVLNKKLGRQGACGCHWVWMTPYVFLLLLKIRHWDVTQLVWKFYWAIYFTVVSCISEHAYCLYYKNVKSSNVRLFFHITTTSEILMSVVPNDLFAWTSMQINTIFTLFTYLSLLSSPTHRKIYSFSAMVFVSYIALQLNKCCTPEKWTSMNCYSLGFHKSSIALVGSDNSLLNHIST